MGIQKVTGCGYSGVTVGYKGFQSVPGGYKGLQGVMGGYGMVWLQGVTGYRGCQVATGVTVD